MAAALLVLAPAVVVQLLLQNDSPDATDAVDVFGHASDRSHSGPLGLPHAAVGEAVRAVLGLDTADQGAARLVRVVAAR